MHGKDMIGNDYWMRKDDHQFTVPFYASRFVKGVKLPLREDWLGLEDRDDGQSRRADTTDCVQDEAPFILA